jgi:hypothetical protein
MEPTTWTDCFLFLIRSRYERLETKRYEKCTPTQRPL